ncbi:DEAD/DEAH box helicase [Rhodoferax aquaticus]|uniref:DEAD/DEAH box helicase n=1 Tax=Rhodoferax aquaticus TaxID=2527691 RepID=A0A515ENI1_9BURK|nr:DEAD/DEAH box helicase [Rhodoferax aquaticus]QDL54223.1 DEAD/DEAH box helicase [Rhodoferax aquaticus]
MPSRLSPTPSSFVFRPRLTLQTLSRGDGLLGLKPFAKLGPRGDRVTVAAVEWTYQLDGRTVWQGPAPSSVLNTRPAAALDVIAGDGALLTLERDLDAERDAADVLRDLGLHPIPTEAFQWRHPDAAPDLPQVWTLAQEAFFGDFWADQVPVLQAKGWSVVVKPGFAHESVPVQAWRLVVEPDTGEVIGRELYGPLAPRIAPVEKLGLPAREGAWLLSLGVEIDGQVLDLAPMLADLLRRDARWLSAQHIAEIDDLAIIVLRAPGGRRIDAPAAPLKAIVGAMVDLLTDPRRTPVDGGPMRFSAWDAERLDALRASLSAMPGSPSAWQLQGEAGLRSLAQRLRAIGVPQPVAQPQGLAVQLRPYQLQGLAWLQYLRAQHLGGILADDMGLGKTAQVLAHVLLEKQEGRLTLPALVVVPSSLVFNWRQEAQRMAPDLRVLALQGAQRDAEFDRMAQHDLVLTTYPLVWRDIDALARQCFHLLVLDEAQMVKNAAGRSARALRQLQARHMLCITGTPLENHLGELWAQFDFLMPGFLGDARSFGRIWRKPIEENGETLRAQLLAQRVRPFILRRRKAEVASELPPKTDITVRLALQGQQRELYEAVRAAADVQVRRVLQRQSFAGAQISILDALLKLRQVCCDPFLLKGRNTPVTMERAKLAWLGETLPVLVEEGRRVLVFSQFTEMLGLVADALVALNLPFVSLTGQTRLGAGRLGRSAVVHQFQALQVPIMLVSLKAGGVGLNLTAADTVVHLDPWWNPAVQEQATARAHRIGQSLPVQVYHVVIDGSIEERMLELQRRKQALTEGVLGVDPAIATKFSEEDLQALLMPLA